MPVGGPTVQLNLDTVYPDLESDFTAWCLGSVRPPSTPGAICKPKLSICASDLLDTVLEVPTTPSSGLINLLGGLTELRKMTH